MLSKLRSRLTYANVTATVALFLTISGGTAIALSGTNTVNSLDIKNATVRTQDLADGAVSRPKLRKNAVDASRAPALASSPPRFSLRPPSTPATR